MPHEPSRAVFLSYAREDAEVARRIAEALRAFGVEVWFDQSELRGGDAWDQKIRTQIKGCALFIPVVSGRTEERTEGYFRREWKLAIDRMQDMAGGRSFIVPVVIDETSEAGAAVPEEFMRYQWTRLAGGEPTPEFVAQVKRLLETPRKTGLPASPKPLPPLKPAESQARPAVRWPVILGLLALIVVAGRYFFLRPGAPPPVAAIPSLSAKPAPATLEVPTNDKSIAVLPFTNMSEEKDSVFFADGIHEDILTNLALVRALRVVSRTSVMQYRGTTKTIREIARELGVAYILEGSVRRAGNKVRVTGQLINAATDEHVWAKNYDRDITDIFAIQSELSQDIASSLSAALSPQEKSLLDRRPTENLEAYDAYTKARQMSLNTTAALFDYATIESLFKKAVALDPKFAVAWANLGRQIVFGYFNEVDRSPERLVEGKAAIDTAVRLDPDAPEVIECYGDFFYYGYRDYARAAEQYERLAVLRPNDANVFGSLGLSHRRQGRFKEGLAELQRAVAIEPRNLRYLSTLQQLVQALNRYDEATALQQRVVELSPGDIFQVATLRQISFFARGSAQECSDLLAQAKPKDAAEAAFLNYGRKAWAAQIGDWAGVIRADGVQRYFDNPAFQRWNQDLITAFALLAQGDRAAARTRATEALPLVQAELERKPSATAWDGLAGVYVVLGRNDEALRAARRAMELVPESSDAVSGPPVSLVYASTLAFAGDKDGALAELARLLRTPFGENIYNAKFGLNWLPLRDDPRFQALVNDAKNNAPLF